MRTSSYILFFLSIILGISSCIALASNVSVSEGREFVVIMLEHPEWPDDVASQKRIAKELQEIALQGPLSEGFDLVHQFQTIPALSGWLYHEPSNRTLGQNLTTRSQRLVDQESVIKAIDRDTGGNTIPVTNPSSGAGGLVSSIPRIRADRLHDMDIKGQSIEVAVLDSGIDTDHPDLSNSIAAQQCYCFNPNGHCCPNGSFQQSGPGSAEDDHNHGTHVSGIIGSNGTQSGVGMAPMASISMVKVIDSNNGFYSTSDIVLALDWLNVNRPGVDVISMSLGTFARFSGVCDNSQSWTQALFIAVENLVSKGVFVVASSGNDFDSNAMGAPACLSNVIAVGAVDNADNFASFSNTDTTLDLFAPGVNIVSSIVGGTASFTGTSMACPHVGGLAALIKQTSPNATNNQIIQAMKSNGVPISANGITRTRIDAYDALCSLYDCAAIKNNAGFIPAILDLINGE